MRSKIRSLILCNSKNTRQAYTTQQQKRKQTTGENTKSNAHLKIKSENPD